MAKVLNSPQRLLLTHDEVEQSSFYLYHSGLFKVSLDADRQRQQQAAPVADQQEQPSRYGISEIQIRGIPVAEESRGKP